MPTACEEALRGAAGASLADELGDLDLALYWELLGAYTTIVSQKDRSEDCRFLLYYLY